MPPLIPVGLPLFLDSSDVALIGEFDAGNTGVPDMTDCRLRDAKGVMIDATFGWCDVAFTGLTVLGECLRESMVMEGHYASKILQESAPFLSRDIIMSKGELTYSRQCCLSSLLLGWLSKEMIVAFLKFVGVCKKFPKHRAPNNLIKVILENRYEPKFLPINKREAYVCQSANLTALFD